MPAPLTPTMPTRSPGPEPPGRVRRAAAGRRGCRSTSSMSMTSLPSRWVANRCSSSRSRGGGTSSISALAASIRNFGFDVRAGGAAAQPGQLLADQVLPPRLRGRGLPLPLGLGQHERGVPALVGVDDPVVHLPRPLAHGVEEPAVVGDHHQRGRPVREVVGQPGDRLDVEVVGGLVEDDQVVVVEQQRGQRAAPPLAAGQARSPSGPASTPASSTSTTSRVAGSAAHSWSALPPSTASRTVWESTSSSPWWR